jgi:hypothetical protein
LLASCLGLRRGRKAFCDRRIPSITRCNTPGEASSGLSIIQQTAFLRLYDLQFGIIDAAARAGLTKLIDCISADLEIRDVGWCAYMLATVKHECHNK